MNDSYDVSVSAVCVCCDRLYMRRCKDFDAAKDAIHGCDACPTCDHMVTELLRSQIPSHFVPTPPNRLDPDV